MSFKAVRDLAEQLKLLGFPNVFPLQALSGSFGSLASFHVVAEILQWLAGLLEPGAILPGGVQTEDERVLLIRSATEFFVTKSAIKLNPRKLYAASAITAVELQKITQLLIAPTRPEDEQDDENQFHSLNQIDIGDKMDDLRRARELSSDLTQRGAGLHDLLSKELINKELRIQQANRPMELNSVERTVKNAIAAAQHKLKQSRSQMENARVDLTALKSKLQRKRGELERTKQRLEGLQKIRPAHMQEFEDCEKELQELFQQYFLRVHVRDALRAQLDARIKRTTPISSPIPQKAAETSMPFIPEGLMEDDDDDDDADAELHDNELLQRATFALDGEIPDIRDEDLMLRDAKAYQNGGNTTAGKRPGTATSRTRPTTGRSRKPTATAEFVRGVRRGPTAERNRDDDSSFGSTDSDLDMSDIMGMSGLGTNATVAIGASHGNTAGAGALTNMNTQIAAGVDADDDFDLNSMDDISISKLTGELPLRPKTASKPEHHSDEDF